MKIIVGVIFIIIIYAAAFGIVIFMMSEAADSLSLIGRCQRVTNKSFFECGDMTKEQLQAISASIAEK